MNYPLHQAQYGGRDRVDFVEPDYYNTEAASFDDLPDEEQDRLKEIVMENFWDGGGSFARYRDGKIVGYDNTVTDDEGFERDIFREGIFAEALADWLVENDHGLAFEFKRAAIAAEQELDRREKSDFDTMLKGLCIDPQKAGDDHD